MPPSNGGSPYRPFRPQPKNRQPSPPSILPAPTPSPSPSSPYGKVPPNFGVKPVPPVETPKIDTEKVALRDKIGILEGQIKELEITISTLKGSNDLNSNQLLDNVSTIKNLTEQKNSTQNELNINIQQLSEQKDEVDSLNVSNMSLSDEKESLKTQRNGVGSLLGVLGVGGLGFLARKVGVKFLNNRRNSIIELENRLLKSISDALQDRNEGRKKGGEEENVKKKVSE